MSLWLERARLNGSIPRGKISPPFAQRKSRTALVRATNERARRILWTRQNGGIIPGIWDSMRTIAGKRLRS
jgi:hypothetical protein